MAISEVEKEERPLNLKKIEWHDFTWIDIVPPAEPEIEYLEQNFHFHRLDLDDCLSRRQLPKIDVYEDYIFLVFHFPVYNRETRISTHAQLSAFIGKKYLITLHDGQNKSLAKLFHDCEINEEARQENFGHGSGYLVYRIFDRAVDSYFPVLDKIMRLMEEMEDSVFDENVESAKELSVLRRDIITQRRIIWPMRLLLQEAENRLQRYAAVDLTVHWGDLMDHMNKICATLDECKEVIEVFKDTDYILATDRINRVIRILNIFATIILPFVVVSSLYGMNVSLPGGVQTGDFKTFSVLMIVMCPIAGGMLFYFRHRHWI